MENFSMPVGKITCTKKAIDLVKTLFELGDCFNKTVMDPSVWVKLQVGKAVHRQGFHLMIFLMSYPRTVVDGQNSH